MFQNYTNCTHEVNWSNVGCFFWLVVLLCPLTIVSVLGHKKHKKSLKSSFVKLLRKAWFCVVWAWSTAHWSYMNHWIISTLSLVFLHVPTVLIASTTSVPTTEVSFAGVHQHVSYHVALEFGNLSTNLASEFFSTITIIHGQKHLLHFFHFFRQMVLHDRVSCHVALVAHTVAVAHTVIVAVLLRFCHLEQRKWSKLDLKLRMRKEWWWGWEICISVIPPYLFLILMIINHFSSPTLPFLIMFPFNLFIAVILKTFKLSLKVTAYEVA